MSEGNAIIKWNLKPTANKQIWPSIKNAGYPMDQVGIVKIDVINVFF